MIKQRLKEGQLNCQKSIKYGCGDSGHEFESSTSTRDTVRGGKVHCVMFDKIAEDTEEIITRGKIVVYPDTAHGLYSILPK